MRQLGLFLGLVTLVAGCGDKDGFIPFNVAPVASILDPLPETVFSQGDTITFRGRVADNMPLDELEIQWSSSIDGVLPHIELPDAQGNLTMETANLSPGVHTITLRALDAGGETGTGTVDIEVDLIAEAPSIVVTHPLVDERGREGFPFVFSAKVNDAQDTPEMLSVELTANPYGLVCFMVPDGAGNASCSATLPLGPYLLTFKATDTDGNVAQADASFAVVTPGDFDADGDGYSPNGGDCNDGASTVFPGADEVCDGMDNDCNALTAIDVGTECYDDDGDGYCEAPPCVNSFNTLPDCNDANPSITNGGTEIVNGQDDDCDGTIDEGTTVYDDDADGYCETPPCINATGKQPDCNDGDFTVYPNATEVCGDGLDNDCDGQLNEKNAQGCRNFYYDNDGDTYGVKGATECYCDSGLAPYTGTTSTDCYDNNAEARPGQAAYFTNDRGDGNYDYNCNGSSEKQFATTTPGCVSNYNGLSCDLSQPGWIGNSVKACGVSGNYIEDCSTDINFFGCLDCYQYLDAAHCNDCLICEPEQGNRVQACR